MKIRYISPLIFTLLFISCSCSFFQDNSEKRPQDIKVDQIFYGTGFISDFGTVHEGRFYVTSENEARSVVCIDIQTGELLWQTFTNSNYVRANPVVLNDKIHVMGWDGDEDYDFINIVEFDMDGNILKTINIDDGEDGGYAYKPYANSFNGFEDKLVWGKHGNLDSRTEGLGLAVLDLSQDVFEEAGLGYTHRGTVRTVYETQNVIYGKVAFVQDLIIFHEYPFHWSGLYTTPTYITAIDKDDFSLRWKMENPLFIHHIGNFPFTYVDENTLITNGHQSYIFDLSTEPPTYQEIEGAWTHRTGSTLYGKYLYIANSTPNGEGAIGCWDTETRQLVWQTPREDVQLDANPQIHNGILYMAAYDGLRLYNAANGEYLGIDKRYPGQFIQWVGTQRWEDIMIVNDGENYFGIKMNWLLDWKGELVKDE